MLSNPKIRILSPGIWCAILIVIVFAVIFGVAYWRYVQWRSIIDGHTAIPLENGGQYRIINDKGEYIPPEAKSVPNRSNDH